MIVSINPTTEKELGRVKATGRKGIDEAVDHAQTAFTSWSRLPIQERQGYLKKLSDVIVEHVDDIAELIAKEQGKPVAEAKLAEIVAVLSILKNLSNCAHRALGDKRSKPELILFSHKRSHYYFEPYGVFSIISAWNYPFSIPMPQIAAAVVAGNTVLFKPSPEAVLIGQKIQNLFDEAGFPPHVVNTVFAKDHDAPRLVEHTGINKVIFTGSADTGEKVMAEAAKQIKPVLFELGGKDPAIVAADANLTRAVNGVVWGSLFTSGQVCASTERVYVERTIAEKFIEKCVQQVRSLKVGDPLDEDTDIGPITTKDQLKIVRHHVEEAQKKGAVCETGGKRLNRPGFFFEPTVLTGVNHSMKVMVEETFGPVLAIMEVDSIDEAIALANENEYGLSAYGWTQSKKTAQRLQRELHAGTVVINDSTFSWGEPTATWGGVKRSGIGRIRSDFGLLEMVQIKYASYDKGTKASNAWWYPYNHVVKNFSDDAVQLLFGKKWLHRCRALLRFLGNRRFLKTANWRAIILNLKKIF